MFLDKILKQINKLLSNSSSYQLTYDKLEFYLEKSIDHIHQTLFTNFRTPQEYFEDSCLYQNVMKYIRDSSGSAVFKGSILSFKPKHIHDADYHIYYNANDETLRYISNDDLVIITPEDNVGYYFFYVEDLGIFVEYYNDGDITTHTKEEPNLTNYYTTIQTLGYDYYDYNEIPDRYIRSCLIYYTAALYLEEEDEFENQYSEYIAKASAELEAWRKQYFCCYDARW